MKRIAMLSDGWHRIVENVIVKSMLNSFADYHDEVIVCQFNSFGNWSKDSNHNRGEYNIYNLPDLTEFDGAILDCNTIEDMAQVENIIRLTKAANIPVVCNGFEVDGYFYAGIDNKRPVYEVMEHLYAEHKCRSFVFAGGPLMNSENSLRTQAYKDFLNLYNISIKDNPILFGDFTFLTGASHFRTMIEKHIPLPDAFVCANDNIAAGLISEAVKYGYHVPEDFLVTGFDNLDKASYYQPQISTVGFDREDIGILCADIFKKVWNGEDVKIYNYCNLEYFFTESCGCPSRNDVDYRDYSRDRIISAVQEEINETHLLNFDGELAQCKEFSQVFECAGKFFSHMDCEEIYFFIDDRLLSASNKASFPKVGYDWKHLNMVFAIEDRFKSRFKSATELLGHLEQEGGNNHYLFTPIHFREQTIGFTVLKNAQFLGNNPYYYDVHNAIVKTLFNLFKSKQLENANKALNELYITDSMTGVYNRVAFTEMIEPSLSENNKKGISCAVCFVDSDDFKHLNDEFGHSYGDRVLKIIATTLKKICPEAGYVCRYGGDEFVIFFPIENGFTAEIYREKVYAALEKDKIQISMGIVETSPSSGMAFDEYTHEADNRMYDEKRRKKGC